MVQVMLFSPVIEVFRFDDPPIVQVTGVVTFGPTTHFVILGVHVKLPRPVIEAFTFDKPITVHVVFVA